MMQIKNNFVRELQEAEKNKKTSLPFIRHQLSLKPKVKKGDVFQVLRIGGSIYQNALVKRINGKIAIVKSIQKPLPVFTSKEVFYRLLKKLLTVMSIIWRSILPIR